MGVPKCPRDTDGLLPPPKQSKIGDFYPTQVSIHNCSEALADKEDTVRSNEQPLSMQEAAGSNKLISNCASVDQLTDKAHFTNLLETNSDATDNRDSNCSNCSSAHLCSLVARTLELIWNNLTFLHSKLDHLIHLHKNHGIIADRGNSCTPASSFQTHCPQKVVACSISNSRPDPAWHLILQPRRACLTICSFKGQTPPWNSKSLVSRHLKTLLAIKQVDLESVELLNNANQAPKALLTFSSPKIPQLLLSRKSFLCSKGVFPTRVFLNTSVAPLFPLLSSAIPIGQKETIPKSVTKPALSSKGINTTSNRAVPFDLINWTDPIESPHPLTVHPVGQTALEGDLLAILKNLSTTEQQPLVPGPVDLSSRLTHPDKIRKCGTPSPQQNSTIMPTCPMFTQSLADSSKLLIEVEAEIHPLVDLEKANPMQSSAVNYTHSSTEVPTGSSLSNGCINFDPNSSLEQLTETN